MTNRKGWKTVVAAVAVATMFLLGRAVFAQTTSSGTPGSTSDPLATVDYVQQAIQKALAGLGSGSSANTLVVVNLAAGQQLVAQAGDRIILRAGTATAVASPLGGLADVTTGVDLKQGQNVPLNHFLVVPRSDGRGVVSTGPDVLLVQGPYSVETATSSATVTGG